jgi:hypothetical protein
VKAKKETTEPKEHGNAILTQPLPLRQPSPPELPIHVWNMITNLNGTDIK